LASSASPAGFSSSVTATNHPLVANYSITIPDGSTVKVQFGPTTSYGLETWQVPAPGGGGAVSLLVAGMTAKSQYHMQALVQLENGTTVPDVDHVFQTGALPTEGMPTLNVSSPGNPQPGVELVNMNPGIPVVTDLAGTVLWFYLSNPTDLANHGHPMPLKTLSDGNVMVLITNRYTGHPNDPYCTLREVDLACNTVSNQYGLRELPMPVLNQRLLSVPTPSGRIVQVNYYSHDFYLLENGHTILLCQEFLQMEVDGQQITVMGDALVDLDEAFMPKWVWSTFDHLDVDRHPYLWEPDHDWTHCNTVAATPDGNLMLSVRNQSWVIKIDYANGTGSGNILWTLGFEGTFQLLNGAPGGWFFAQHYPNILGTSGGNITSISVVDNGNYRPGTDPPEFSRGLILNLNEQQQQAQVVWQYPVSPDFYSYWGGNVVQLANGNMEICMSRPSPQYSFAREVTYVTQELVWQMTIAPPYAYRCYRIPSLYPGVQW
jgi:arylsulfate sulfotransferase